MNMCVRMMNLIFIALLTLSLPYLTFAACPTLADLEDQNAVPDSVRQISSDRVSIDWSNLWSNFAWTEECFSAAFVLMEDLEIEMENVGRKNATVQVRPCEEARFRVKVTLTATGESFASHRTEADFMTYKGPKAKVDPVVSVEYVEDDLTKVRVKSRFVDLAEDAFCRKVTATELRFREKKQSEDDDEEDLWTVVKSARGVFRNLDTVIEGLDNICAEYEIVLQLVGTPGTEASPVLLAVLPPVEKSLLKSSFEAGFDYSVPTAVNVTAESISPTSIEVTWNESSCADGYLITASPMASESSEEVVSLETTDLNVTIEELFACKKYQISVTSILRVDEAEDNNYFEGEPASVTASTQLDAAAIESYRLSTLNVRSGRTSATFSWSKNEWPCAENETVLVCEEEDNNCIEAGGPGIIVDDRVAFTVQGLKSCTLYTAKIQPMFDFSSSAGGLDYITLDNNDDNNNNATNDRQLTFETVLTTALSKRAPRRLEAVSATENSVTLTWIKDPCAKAYIVSISSQKNSSVIEGTRFFDAKSLEEEEIPDEIGSGFSSQDLDDIDENGEESRKRKKRRSDDDYSPEYADVNGEQRDVAYDYDTFMSNNYEDTTPLLSSSSESNSFPSDDEDYSQEDSEEGSGSGDDDDETGGKNKSKRRRRIRIRKDEKRLRAALDALVPCHDYEFKVQSVYEDKDGLEELFGPSSSVRHSTHCAPIPTPDFHHLTVEFVDSKLIVSWRQTAGIPSKISVTEGSKEVLRENIESEEEHFMREIPADFCKHYHVAVSRQDDSEVVKKSVVSPLNPNLEFALSEMRVEITSSAQTRGEALLSWIHDLQCVTRYKLRVSDDFGNSGERIVIPGGGGEDDGAKMTVDLNMIPGLLNLHNCREYRLAVFPTKMHEIINEGDLSASLEFVYADREGNPANVNVDGNTEVKLTVTDKEAAVSWVNPPTCLELRAEFSPRIGMHEIYDDVFVEREIYPKLDEKSTSVGNLKPCAFYRVRLVSIENEAVLHERRFRTEPRAAEEDEGVDTVELLGEEDVVIWTDEIDPTEAKIEWTDRCIDYNVVLCQQGSKNECRTHRVTDSQSITLSSLVSCSAYDFNISANFGEDESFVLYSGNFSTNLAPSFSFKPKEFRAEAAENVTNGVEISWKNSPPCFDAFLIQIFFDELPVIEQEAPNSAGDFNVILNLADDASVPNCVNLTAVVTPSSISHEKNAPFKTTFEYFTGPTIPETIDVIGVNETAVSLNWTSTRCDTGFEVDVSTFEGESVFSSSDLEKAQLSLDNLSPCTKYEVRISTLGSYGIQTGDFVTDHSDDIKIVATTVEYERVVLEILFLTHGSHCVHHYNMFLCEAADSPRCYNKTFVRNLEDRETTEFENLEEGTLYKHQLVGYNANSFEVFFASEDEIRTKQRITADIISLKRLSTADSFQLSINASVRLIDGWSAQIVCSNEEGDFTRLKNVTATNVTFDDLPNDMEFLCKGHLEQGGSKAVLRPVKAFTTGGLPEAPLFLRANDTSSDFVGISWEEPIQTNGRIDEYKVNISPQCIKKNRYCSEFCPEKSYELTAETFLELEDVSPGVTYLIRVSARTVGNEEYGEESNTLEITIPGLNKTAAPKLTHIEAMRVNGIRVTFKPICPLFADFEPEFKPNFICDGCRFQPKGNIERVSDFVFEISHLPGGNFYQVWIEAGNRSDEGEAAKSAVKVVYLDCEHQCDDGFCVNTKKKRIKCDFVEDCPDGSDEFDCSCDPPERFECDNGHCINFTKRCNGNADCNDFSDEADCPTCQGDMFRCETSEECVPMNMTCDRKVHCRDGSDEHGCAYWTSTCWPEMFRCLDHSCIDMVHRCNGVWDCVGGEDEVGCGAAVCADKEHSEDGFVCRDKSCIKMSAYCNGEIDCKDGTDELDGCGCNKKGLFACESDLTCISRLKVCDGMADCSDNSDESKCYRKRLVDENRTSPKFRPVVVESSTTTTTTTTTTPAEPTNINLAQQDSTAIAYVHFPEEEEDEYYDLIRPIPSSSPEVIQSASQVKHTEKDESRAKEESSLYHLRVYPESQWIYEGHDAVLQCRDEGELRAKVRWSRKDGEPLNRSKTVQGPRGRLTIYRVSNEDDGIYLCSVVGKDAIYSESIITVRSMY